MAVSSGGIGANTVQAAEWPVQIRAARLGFAGDDGQPLARFGRWAPVEVILEVRAPVQTTAKLVMSAPDPDGITTWQHVPLPLAGVEVGRTVSTGQLDVGVYVCPVGETDIVLQVRSGEDERPLSEPFRLRVGRLREALGYSVLFLGVTPQQFELPRPVGAGESTHIAALRGGRIITATVTAAEQLPLHWCGYEAVDLAVLVLGKECQPFLQQWWSESASSGMRQRQAALQEWVRRGGRLVVAGGSAAASVAQWPRLQQMLPATINGVRRRDLVVLHWNARASSQFGAFHSALGSKAGPFPVAELIGKPQAGVRLLIPPPERQQDTSLIPVAWQWPYGLGRVTLIAFDLHGAPFTEFPLRAEFWDWVLQEGGANRASVGSEGRPKPTDADLSEEEDELAVALRTHADAFEEIPVISFGWVAVLIALYLLLIGPLEYLLLKRFIGRQEWTWAVFPVVVVTVAGVCFATAAYLKGEELRINKMDVVDVDTAAGRIYGTTWFSLFSPRIARYTLSVMPHSSWAEADPQTVLSWWGAPRGPRAGLLPRQYRWSGERDQPLSVLADVPIQVWSTKAFVANWAGRWNAAGARVQSQLEHPPADPRAVMGTFTLDLPVPVLTDCVVFYAGSAYQLPGGIVQRGIPVRVVLERGNRADQWLQRAGRLEELLLRAPVYRERLGPALARGALKTGSPEGEQRPAAPLEPTAAALPLPLLGLLFHEGCLSFSEGVYPRNASLRRWDQSWRLHAGHTHELILVGRMALPVGPAEPQLTGPYSPSVLWWQQSPASGQPRTPLSGRGRQETWVRIYLPIASPSQVGSPQP
jgi:hypothetical protein